MRSSGYAADELDVRAQTELVDQIVAGAIARFADDGQRDVALGAQLGHCLEQVGEALQGDVGRRGGDQSARCTGDARLRYEQLGIDAHRHETHAVEADAHVGVDVFDRVLADDDDARHAAGDAALHLHEVVPATDRVALPPRRGVGHLQCPIAGDRVVQRGDRGDELLDAQDAVAEALVVVHQIEVGLTLLQRLQGAHAERQWFAERAAEMAERLGPIGLGLQLPVAGEPAREVIVPEVEARQLMQRERSSRIGYGWPPKTSTVWPRSTSALVRWRVYTPWPPTCGLPR